MEPSTRVEIHTIVCVRTLQGPGESYTTSAQRRGPGLRRARKGPGADQSGPGFSNFLQTFSIRGVQSIWGVQFMHIISLCMLNKVLIIIFDVSTEVHHVYYYI